MRALWLYIILAGIMALCTICHTEFSSKIFARHAKMCRTKHAETFAKDRANPITQLRKRKEVDSVKLGEGPMVRTLILPI